MNVYEWVVHAYLQQRDVVFGRMADVVRAPRGTGNLKNFDYLIATERASVGPLTLESARRGAGHLLEVKGRQFPTGGGGRWENWITRDDLTSLQSWQREFGESYTGLLVFAYAIQGHDVRPARPWTPMTLDSRRFGLVACRVDDYADHARIRSRKWGTLTVAKKEFLTLIRPLGEWV